MSEPTDQHFDYLVQTNPTTPSRTITVGDVRDMLAGFARDTPLADAGLTAEITAMLARQLALAPPVTRIDSATRRISKGFRLGDEAEAIGL